MTEPSLLQHTPPMKAGDRYGSWTVLVPYPVPGPRAFCRCDCGTELLVARPNLISGASSRCSRCNHRDQHERYLKDLTGAVAGRWHVTADPDWRKGGQRRVEATCRSCGFAHRPLSHSLANRPCPECYRRKVAKRALATQAAVEATGLSRQAIHQRVNRGWTRQEAVSTPKGASPARRRASKAA